MKISIVHTDPAHQPVAATVAREIHRHLPSGLADLTCASKPDSLDQTEFVLAVFSLRPGAFAPVVPCYRELRGKKVAFLAILTGAVDQSRLRKTVWGIKKQFCGNHVVAGYLCPAEDEEAWGLTQDELTKALEFARRVFEEYALAPDEAMAGNVHHGRDFNGRPPVDHDEALAVNC